MIPKTKPFRSENLRRAAASLPCQHCGLEGRTQASHSNQSRDGRGMSYKSSDAAIAALCDRCHHEVDYGQGSREEKLQLWEDAHRRTMRTLIEGEYLVVDPRKLSR
jgi:phage terminase large subunit GpA-like protein